LAKTAKKIPAYDTFRYQNQFTLTR